MLDVHTILTTACCHFDLKDGHEQVVSQEAYLLATYRSLYTSTLLPLAFALGMV
jgi:hypothetical protein